MEKEINAIELNPDKMVKVRCIIEHAQLSLREDAYPTLIREGETATIPETCAFIVKANKKKIRFGFEEVIQRKAKAAPQMGGFPSVNDVQQTDDPDGDDEEIQSTQMTEEQEAEALKLKRSESAKKAAATRKANAESGDKKKD